jgi:hypothetical protein
MACRLLHFIVPGRYRIIFLPVEGSWKGLTAVARYFSKYFLVFKKKEHDAKCDVVDIMQISGHFSFFDAVF